MGMPQSSYLIQVVERLSHSRSMESISGIVAQAARHLSDADGATFVLRDHDKCYYADENAISPLWKGKRFPLQSCISGCCMMEGKVIAVPDIYKDPRIPHDAYRPTFVKSLCVVPIREEAPIGAIGIYWSKERVPTDEEIKLLSILANSSAIAIENLELKSELSNKWRPSNLSCTPWRTT